MLPNFLKMKKVMSIGVAAFIGATALGSHAKAEDTVLFYSSLTTRAQQELVKGVEAAFDGLKVEWVRAGGVGLFQRFAAERSVGKGKIDLLHFSYAPGWPMLADNDWVVEGVAEMPEAEGFYDWAKDSETHTVALRTPTLRVVYNTENVSPDEIPTSWQEFITDKWKGRIVMNDPFESAGTWDFFYGNEEVFGKEYISKLLANDTLVQRGMGGATDIVARGERDVSFVFEYIVTNRIQKGAKIAIAEMEEGVPVIPAPFGMIKGGPNPEIAKKVFAWIIGPEGQKIIVDQVLTYSGRKDVAPPPMMKPLSEEKLIHSDWTKVYKEQDEYRDFITKNLKR